jgi:hypothetical protein
MTNASKRYARWLFKAPEDGTRLVILIDALDELPSWLGVFITTRPEVDICDCSREREEHGGFPHFFFAHAVF